MRIGILTVKGPKGFTGNRANFRALSRMGNRMNIPVFVVPAESIDLEQNFCLGYRWNAAGWKPMKIPLPSVFYNRISTRKAESRADVIKLKKGLQKLGIPLYNPQFFDKSELYDIVGTNRETADILPETAAFSMSQLKRMLARYGKVYVKPVQSKAGHGILRIDRAARGVMVHSQENGRRITRRMSIRELYTELVHNRKFHRYVLQRSIDLAKIEDHPYDLRILLQKDRFGKWGITGIGARVAPVNGIMTHVPNGGSIRRAEDVLQATFQDRAHSILADVKRNAMAVASVIERNTNGIVGEMSIDMGVDQSGRMWFFEANAKPMKFDEPDIRLLSLQRILEFCKLLSDRQENNGN